MLLYNKGKENGKLLVDLVLNGRFDYGTVTKTRTATTPATVRKRRYDELTEAEKIHEACDIKATNIVLQGLPQDIYNLVNHHEEAKHIWDRVKLLIEGSKISLQEREAKLYDEFEMFTSVPGETINSYYLSNFDQLYAYLRQHEAHADEVRIMKERFLNSLALVANHSLVIHRQSYQAPDVHQPSQASFPVLDLGLVVPSFLTSDDPIASLNKAMAFISTTFTSWYPPTNNQLRTSSNPRNHATIQDGRVQVQTIQGRKNQGYASSGATSNATTIGPRNSAWFKEKAMLAEALESRIVLDEEQMAFLADNGDIDTTSQ
ncbi:hypothetical protein Tco_1355346 [Tanacetum coccineum]